MAEFGLQKRKIRPLNSSQADCSSLCVAGEHSETVTQKALEKIRRLVQNTC